MEFVLSSLKTGFEVEISNNIVCNEKEIIVFLSDKTKVKITTK